MSQTTILSDLHELFTETGMTLVQAKYPQVSSGKVRDLQAQLAITANQLSISPSLRCFIFFLDLIIDDIFYNLSGDAPYENDALFETRDTVFAQVGKTFVEVGEHLGELEAPWLSLCELVSVYLEELHGLNNA